MGAGVLHKSEHYRKPNDEDSGSAAEEPQSYRPSNIGPLDDFNVATRAIKEILAGVKGVWKGLKPNAKLPYSKLGSDDKTPAEWSNAEDGDEDSKSIEESNS
ncbi:hypothetical protein FXO38_00756 [Capsicum annuum]|nr:hypothetical protein FXO38_00756 [Capsicum annuum]